MSEGQRSRSRVAMGLCCCLLAAPLEFTPSGSVCSCFMLSQHLPRGFRLVMTDKWRVLWTQEARRESRHMSPPHVLLLSCCRIVRRGQKETALGVRVPLCRLRVCTVRPSPCPPGTPVTWPIPALLLGSQASARLCAEAMSHQVVRS